MEIKVGLNFRGNKPISIKCHREPPYNCAKIFRPRLKDNDCQIKQVGQTKHLKPRKKKGTQKGNKRGNKNVHTPY